MQKNSNKVVTTTVNTTEKQTIKKTGTSTFTESSKTITTQTKCSLQEGVRMMVTPSMFMTRPPSPKEKAILNPPVNVQKAFSVTQSGATTKMVANIASSQLKTIGAVATSGTSSSTVQTKKPEEVSSIPLLPIQNLNNTVKSNGINNSINNNNYYSLKMIFFIILGTSNWKEQRATSPTTKTLGRQKRIIEPSLTPATTPVSQTAAISPNEDRKLNYKLSTQKKNLKSFEKPIEYGSPDSPMSKMNIMANPSQDIPDGLLSPKSISQLEFPTPERLLPIGQHGKDGMCSLVEKVREALAIPDISHLKHDVEVTLQSSFIKRR